uniref:COR domain-containing protein n=1 Tax=Macrostomum lignano TaxID=282301 RepID=A0A1I8FGG9_9PLAT
SCSTVEGCDAELRRLKPWLVNIKAQAPACPVICVGTHADTLPSSGPNRDTIIANIRTRIETMIPSTRLPGDCRILIQSALEAFKVKGHHDLPVLQWYQLRKMATDAGLNMNDEKLSQAVRFLHESGVLLHFDDSTYRLNNLYFIDPQWLCRMMAQIVTVKEIKRVHPVGRDAAISVLLFTGKRITEEDRHFIFPVSQIPQYLRILEKFEIVLPQKNDELLIPCRLPDIAARDVTELAPTWSPVCIRCLSSPLDSGLALWLASTTSLTRILPRAMHPARPRNLLLVVIDRSSITLRSQHPEDGQAGHVCLLAASGDWNRRRRRHSCPLYDEAFFLLQTFEEATPEGGEGLQLAGPALALTARLPASPDRPTISMLFARQSLSQQQQQQPHQARSSSSAVVFHTFSFDDIVNEAGIAEAIRCFAETGHPELVPLSSLAPDVTLSDLPARLQLDSNRLELVQTQDHLLGQPNTTRPVRSEDFQPKQRGIPQPTRLLRQERRPSLSGWITRHWSGCWLWNAGPNQLVLELAPMGALHQLLQQKRIRDRGLQHRLMHQVTQGLAFLHAAIPIIYRDLKLDNAHSIDPLFKKGCPDWPHLELIINRCLIRREAEQATGR